MRSNRTLLRRRSVLRGAGSFVVGLPFLESVMSNRAMAAGKLNRMVLLWKPEGSSEGGYFPSGSETGFSFPASGAGFEPIKKDLIVIKGCKHVLKLNARPHPRAMRDMFTAGGKDSFDQILGNKLGAGVRFKTIEFGVGTSPNSDDVAENFMSFRGGAGVPHPGDPNKVFARIFAGAALGASNGAPNPEQIALAELHARRRSVLDGVLEQLGDLNQQVSASDRILLDAHTTSIRDVEDALFVLNTDMEEAAPSTDVCAIGDLNASVEGVRQYEAEHVLHLDRISKTVLDMVAVALRCNLTRVASVMFTRGASRQRYNQLLDVSSTDHHGLAHGERAQLDKVVAWYTRQFAYLWQKIRDVPDGPGKTMLDTTGMLFITDLGVVHRNENLPMAIVGGRDYFRLGRSLKTKVDSPRIYASFAQALGTDLRELPGSPGPLATLGS